MTALKRAWNEPERALLRELRADGDPIADIAAVLSRDEREVRAEIKQMSKAKLTIAIARNGREAEG